MVDNARQIAESLKQKIATCEARGGIIGLGYVGLPLAVEFAKACFGVTGFEVDGTKVSQIINGISYIKVVPTSEVAKLQNAGKLCATTDFTTVAQLDRINICVPPSAQA